MGHGARYVEGDDLAAEIGSTTYPAGLVVERSGGLQPARFHAGLVARARAAGATLHPHAPVTARRARRGRPATGRIRCRRRPARRQRLRRRGRARTCGAGSCRWGRSSSPPSRSPPSCRRRCCPPAAWSTTPATCSRTGGSTPTGGWCSAGGGAWRRRRSRRRGTCSTTGWWSVHPQLEGVAVERAWGGEVAITRDRLPHCGRIDGAWYAGGLQRLGRRPQHVARPRAWPGRSAATSSLRSPSSPTPGCRSAASAAPGCRSSPPPSASRTASASPPRVCAFLRHDVEVLPTVPQERVRQHLTVVSGRVARRASDSGGDARAGRARGRLRGRRGRRPTTDAATARPVPRRAHRTTAAPGPWPARTSSGPTPSACPADGRGRRRHPRPPRAGLVRRDPGRGHRRACRHRRRPLPRRLVGSRLRPRPGHRRRAVDP